MHLLRHVTLGLVLPCIALAAVSTVGLTAHGDAQPLVYADQGRNWTTGARAQFYRQDQGAQLILYSWLKALKSADGKPFLDGALARYGYLPDTTLPNGDLPIGFTLASGSDGQMVGMTCAACHTRQINVSNQAFRIDGGPAIADFESFLQDLDTSALAVLADPAAFSAFAAAVLGPASANASSRDVLRADLTVWSTRFHVLMTKSLPIERRWGPARLDAVSMILNRVTGLDIGLPPIYAIADNIRIADAPTRYPFLWNASRQDRTQWPGFAPNGNDLFALSRNLGEVYGVFGLFHPELTTGSVTLLNRNYVVHNSGSFSGLQALEDLIKRIGPPAWQWPVDETLAARGKTIYETVKTGPANQTCADCHGIRENHGLFDYGTWKTPLWNVGSDQAEWRVLGRYAATGVMEGASIPDAVPTLLARDSAVNVLKASVAGAIAEEGVSSVTHDFRQTAGASPMLGAAPAAEVAADTTASAPVHTIVSTQTASQSTAQLNSLIQLPGMQVRAIAVGTAPPSTVNVYESRVMQGIWAAAPYLHNGSVPTLADLLKPAPQRPTAFAVGQAYDLTTVGLAVSQPGSTFTLHTTGCDAAGLQSGDSNCGHEYGTQLSDDDKKALLEYLKIL